MAEPLLDLAVTLESHLADGARHALAEDVLDGLTQPFKELAPKHFYDDVGSALFDAICDLPEYYPTRCERDLLLARGADIAERTNASEVLELGSGTATKTRLLLSALHERGALRRYLPVDVTGSLVERVAHELAAAYAGLHVHGVSADFEHHLERLPRPRSGRRLVVFLGGTIGNFAPGARRRFLRRLAATLRTQDWLLLGCDLVKDPATLEAAYNDAAGVTAAFNLNVLNVINRELDADFDVDAFEHVAFYDREHEWIEMRLRARRAMQVRIAALDLAVRFSAREEMRTEISAKFTPERLTADLDAAGLVLDRLHTDGRFALALARPRDTRLDEDRPTSP